MALYLHGVDVSERETPITTPRSAGIGTVVFHGAAPVTWCPQTAAYPLNGDVKDEDMYVRWVLNTFDNELLDDAAAQVDRKSGIARRDKLLRIAEEKIQAWQGAGVLLPGGRAYIDKERNVPASLLNGEFYIAVDIAPCVTGKYIHYSVGVDPQAVANALLGG